MNTINETDIEQYKAEDKRHEQQQQLAYEAGQRPNVWDPANHELELVDIKPDGNEIFKLKPISEPKPDSDPGAGDVYKVSFDRFGRRNITKVGTHRATGYDKNNIRQYEFVPSKENEQLIERR